LILVMMDPSFDQNRRTGAARTLLLVADKNPRALLDVA
jgi:hypothetical protein